jgi:hypothetical protein
MFHKLITHFSGVCAGHVIDPWQDRVYIVRENNPLFPKTKLGGMIDENRINPDTRADFRPCRVYL